MQSLPVPIRVVSSALCGHANFTMNGAKTARVPRVGLTGKERRRRPRLMEAQVFTLNSGFYRRWRLETGERRRGRDPGYCHLIFLTRINNTCNLLLTQVGLKSPGPGPEPEQKK